MKRILFITALCLSALMLAAQTERVKFAFIADTHIADGSGTNDDLLQCINDINNFKKELQFVIFAGDITEFGSDEEIFLAKKIIDNLEIPYYIVAGNHDSKWSESGCNTFAKVFGYENFEFEAGGIKFLGSNSGPNMRMAPALMPHESLVWLDSIAKATPLEQPVIFVNHYPQDTSMLNYFQVLNTLKQTNIQLVMGGHWNRNTILDYDGVPGVLGRAPAAGRNGNVGYNIVNIENNRISIYERQAADSNGKGGKSGKAWYSREIFSEPQFTPDKASGRNNEYALPANFPWLTFDVNRKYPQVETIWKIQDESDIGSGAIKDGKYILYANTQGVIKALDSATGSLRWRFATGGKVFSTPAISGSKVVIGSTDGYIYCLNLRKGTLLWKYKCKKSVLGSPVIMDNMVYIGASDNIFRAISLRKGKLIWQYDSVKGFVECKPFADKEQIVFGDWANSLYSLDPATGKEQWVWRNKGSRMLSPAAVWPVKSNGKIFIVTPARKCHAIDAGTGKEIWRVDGGRESIALSKDGSRVFVKNMFNSIQCWSTLSDDAHLEWNIQSGLGYDIAPTPAATILLKNGREMLIVPTDKGNIFCFDGKNGNLVWKHKISVALINSIEPIGQDKLLISTMDGVVTMLSVTF